MYFSWYYPVGFVKNTTSDDEQIRGFLVFLFLWMFMLFTSTFSHLVITWIENPETAGVLATLLWMLCISFCGVGVVRADLPGFWNFMYRVSPGTYLVSGVMSASIANSDVVCSTKELVQLQPPTNMSCSEFLDPFMEVAGGKLVHTAAGDVCSYCPQASTNDFLAGFEIYYDDRWRNFGLLWVYVGVNIVGALALYWLVRVPKGQGSKKA